MKALGWLVALGVTAAAFGADGTYKGYLTDKMCAGSSTAMDGTDMKTHPGDHTVACAVACAKGGYGLMMQDGSTYKFVPFSSKGNDLAAAMLKSTTRTKGMYVEVTGSMNGSNLDVSQMKEGHM